MLITDGPYLETKEHIGGLWILEAADLDEALAWRRKGAVACRAPVEVRPFLSGPPKRAIEIVFTAPAAGEQKPIFMETA